MSKKARRHAKDKLISEEVIKQKILVIRGIRVILDMDLARVYGVKTKALVQAVKRNKDRFPPDFVFQLTASEYEHLRSQFVTSSWGGRRYLPYVFAEHGALMAANVLNSKRAVAMSICVIRAFVRLRAVFLENQILEVRLTEIEELLVRHDVALEDVYEKIKQLFLLSKKPGSIDFQSGNGNA